MVVYTITRGAKALTVYPYSVILKGAKNIETNGRVNVSSSRPADRRPKSKRQYVLCLGTEAILKYIHQTLYVWSC